MRLFCTMLVLFFILLGLLVSWAVLVERAAAAIPPRACPYAMGESCPRGYGVRLCPTLVYDLATAADVYDVDFIMHSAGCRQAPAGAWIKRTGSNSACDRRAYWLVDHGYSILRTRAMLAHRGCRQFEDGSYVNQ